eukprot:1137321-Prymnesium_polylepis.1
MVHLAEEPSPLHVTIAASGEALSEPKSLCLGGSWQRTELEEKSDNGLRKIATAHGLDLDRQLGPDQM